MSTTTSLTIINGFNIWLTFTQAQLSQDTYKYYLKHFKCLKDFFQNNNIEYFDQITTYTFDAIIVFLKNKGLSNTTINKHITTLKICINFLNERKLTNVYVPKKIKLPETQPKIEIIETEDLKEILIYLDQNKNKNMKLCFLLMLTTGIRRTELTKIKVNNIDLKNGQIYLEDTKNHKPRMIYIITDEIKDLITELENQIPNQKFLFYSSKTNGYVTPNTVSSYFTKIKKDLELKTLSPHKLRHTYATMLINNGADMNSVRLLLGHSTLYMTQRYIQMTNNKLKNINNEFNPLNDLL